MGDFDNGNLDVYERKLCYDECEKMYAEAVILINMRLVRLIDVTIEQRLDLKYGDHTMVSNEVKESVIATWLIRSFKNQFDEYMEIKKQKEVYRLDAGMEYDPSNVDFDEWYVVPAEGELKNKALNSKAIFEGSKGVDEEPSDNDRTHYSPSDEWEDLERADHIGANSNYNPYLDVSRIFNDHVGINNDYETQKDEGWFDEHELMEDDDDNIGDLKDYLIQKDPPYYINKEEERSKERRSNQNSSR
ncbi:hypothetical protein Tco_1322399 [Tanacetum coccineum]